ncbi:hypothetical protein PVAP13_1KG181300 [Panicum virgatum]|nr:hypothetical protein PVAP13_1KG181300 [Panicum virgatum]
MPPETADALSFYNKAGTKPRTPTNKLKVLEPGLRAQEPRQGAERRRGGVRPVEAVHGAAGTFEKSLIRPKAVIRVLPIWSTGILPSVIVGQQMFLTLQAKTMQRKVGGREIPAATFGIFSILTLTVWVAVYDRALVRPLSRLTGHVRGLSLRQRMGADLVLFAVAMAVAARAESVRRAAAIAEGLIDADLRTGPDTHVGHAPGAAALPNGARRGAEPHRADRVVLLRVPQDHVQRRGVAAGARPRLRRRAGQRHCRHHRRHDLERRPRPGCHDFCVAIPRRRPCVATSR